MIFKVFLTSKLRISIRKSPLNSINNAFLSSIKGKYLYNYTLKKKEKRKKKEARFVRHVMVLETCIFLMDRDDQYIK